MQRERAARGDVRRLGELLVELAGLKRPAVRELLARQGVVPAACLLCRARGASTSSCPRARSRSTRSCASAPGSLGAHQVWGFVDGTTTCTDLRGLAAVHKAEFERLQDA